MRKVMGFIASLALCLFAAPPGHAAPPGRDDTAKAMATIFNSPERVLVNDESTVISGRLFAFTGDGVIPVFAEYTLNDGVFWNPGPDSAWVVVGDDPEPLEIPVNGLFTVDLARTLSATCGEGYYCCGTGTGSNIRVRCHRDGTDSSMCLAGGEGSKSCSISD